MWFYHTKEYDIAFLKPKTTGMQEQIFCCVTEKIRGYLYGSKIKCKLGMSLLMELSCNCLFGTNGKVL